MDWPMVPMVRRDSVEWGNLDDPLWAPQEDVWVSWGSPGWGHNEAGLEDGSDVGHGWGTGPGSVHSMGPLEDMASDLMEALPSSDARFLDAFYVKWFLLFPEKSHLSGFDLEAAQHFHKQDLIKMLVWLYWQSLIGPPPSATAEAGNKELDEARIIHLSLEAAPQGISSLAVQIEVVEAGQVKEDDVLDESEDKTEDVELTPVESAAKTCLRPTPVTYVSNATKTATFYAALEALKDLDEDDKVNGENDGGVFFCLIVPYVVVA
ncbi:uncharacterized protein ARMOST_20334 [Armillaria ostoyae]|uniref:Uncharacterized protein n=1 Tax=Armillaria ostoyae TaxID=47428 RepID=A0A284S723_ARMOS|nr:uncharacterized protein ARMOST_20334 [Armillaria ostoyae]